MFYALPSPGVPTTPTTAMRSRVVVGLPRFRAHADPCRRGAPIGQLLEKDAFRTYPGYRLKGPASPEATRPCERSRSAGGWHCTGFICHQLQIGYRRSVPSC